MLAVDGNLDVTSATLNVTVSSAPSGPVIIATYTSLTDETFAATTGADDFTIDFNYEDGNVIALLPPPAGTLIILR